MAKSTVPVNFKDDIMNSAMGGKRRYRMINNSDGTISLEDVTTYDQVGSTFGAAQMNATNKAVNAAADASKIIDDIDAIRALTQEGYMAGALALKQVDDSLGNLKFGIDGDGNRGYYGADGRFIPFKSGNNNVIFEKGINKKISVVSTTKTAKLIYNLGRYYGEYSYITVKVGNNVIYTDDSTTVPSALETKSNVYDISCNVGDIIEMDITSKNNNDMVTYSTFCVLVY